MDRLLRFFYNPRNLFILGLLAAVAISMPGVFTAKYTNFKVFADSTMDFWRGVNPYTPEWVAEHTRFFLYSPIFSVLFAPFAFLPKWLGPIAWNVFNFSMYFLAIFSLPQRFSNTEKCRIFLYTFLILGASMLCYQYNITVAWIFLLAYSLLERDKGGWAVLLIMLSGMTKIYGIFQLGLLLCYPRFWRNMGYVAVTGAALFALPLLKLPVHELIPYYMEWFGSLSAHQSAMTYESIFYAHPFLDKLLPYFREVQMGVLAILAGLLIFSGKKYASFDFRAQALGILMGWVVLFSDSAEMHTYVIALAGYMLWYWRHRRTKTDKVLFWANFVLLCIVPIDILCPVPVMRFICHTLWLHVWVFLITWLRMMYITFLKPLEEPGAVTV